MVIAAVNCCCLLVLLVLALIVTCICVDLSMEYHEIQFGELVGRGSFANVHKGVWRGQTVALKRIQIPSGMDKSQVVANSREVAALRYMHGFSSAACVANR